MKRNHDKTIQPQNMKTKKQKQNETDGQTPQENTT
jgi:hypothetical protein